MRTLVEVWYNILVTFRNAAPGLAKMCLANLKAYIGNIFYSFVLLDMLPLILLIAGWIDVQLIVNDRFIPLFFELLSVENLKYEACECLYEVQ